MVPVPTNENRITYFAETDARNKRQKFGIRAEDRTRHVYVIGKTGMGKSTLLENMAAQDIQNGEGMCFIDPHGKSADLLLEYVPKERIRDVIHIAPFDVEYPISFNVLESVDPAKRHLVVSGLMSTFKKIWEDAWSARMEYILTNTLLALLEAPNTTLLGVNRMLSDKVYRNEIISHVTDPSVKTFWVKEFANYTERMAAEAVPAIQNKVGQFTANPLIRNMIGQSVSSFDFRQAMDSRKIIIINLSKGRIGDENMKLLGGLLVTKIYLAAMSRADVPDRVMKMLPNFYLFVDEFQNFANASFADILSEARKYKLNLTIAHQYVEQMDEIVRPAVFGNVGTMIAFRVGANDAELLEKEFAPAFTIEDLVNLGKYQLYLKLMIDGLSSSPFSATTIPPISHPDNSYVPDIIAASREQFARPRAEVEKGIVAFHDATPAVKKLEALGDKGGDFRKQAPTAKIQEVPIKPKSVPVPVVSPQVPTKNDASVVRTTQVISVPTPTPVATQLVKTTPEPVIGSSPITNTTQLSSPMPPRKIESVPAKVTPKLEGHNSLKAALSSVLPKTIIEKPVQNVSSATTSSATSPSRSNSGVAKQSSPVPQKAPAPVQKPASLSSLASKPSNTKRDPKVPTQQNMSALKDALAAAMNKGKSVENKLGDIPLTPTSEPASGAVTPKLTSTKKLKPVPKIAKPKIPAITSATDNSNTVTADKPAEVPKDVLAQVLKL